MKMIFAIVHDEDSGFVIDNLTKHEFMVTKLSSSGGFLKRGSTTLLVGTDDDKVDNVINIDRKSVV